jgi:hypothetical protein
VGMGAAVDQNDMHGFSPEILFMGVWCSKRAVRARVCAKIRVAEASGAQKQSHSDLCQ